MGFRIDPASFCCVVLFDHRQQGNVTYDHRRPGLSAVRQFWREVEAWLESVCSSNIAGPQIKRWSTDSVETGVS